MSWRNQPRDSRGRFTKSYRGSLVAVVVVLALAGGGAAGAMGGGHLTAGRSPAGGQGTQVRAGARSSAQVVRRLESRGMRVERRGADADGDCVTHSYGQVREFFGRHPCSALYRALFEVRDGRGTALVAVAWVDMPDDAQAPGFQQLVDRQGTGNVTELGPASVTWTGEHYTSVRDGVTVVNAQAEPVDRSAGSLRLAQLVPGAVVG